MELMLPRVLFVTLSSPYFISPRAQMTTAIVSVCISHILLISISRSLYLDILCRIQQVIIIEGTFSADSSNVSSRHLHLPFNYPCTAQRFKLNSIWLSVVVLVSGKSFMHQVVSL